MVDHELVGLLIFHHQPDADHVLQLHRVRQVGRFPSQSALHVLRQRLLRLNVGMGGQEVDDDLKVFEAEAEGRQAQVQSVTDNSLFAFRQPCLR